MVWKVSIKIGPQGDVFGTLCVGWVVYTQEQTTNIFDKTK